MPLDTSKLKLLLIFRQKPINMTDEELAKKFQYLFHFKGNGNASDAEYESLNNVRKEFGEQKLKKIKRKAISRSSN